MHILVVEDDYLQTAWLQENLTENFPGVKISVINTESEFRRRLVEIFDDELPDVVLMDVMLRWTNPAPNMQSPPEDVQQEGFYKAGIRCERLVRQNPRTKHIPVVLYSMLERSDLAKELGEQAPWLDYTQKEADIQPLLQKIREHTQPAAA